MEKSHQKLLHLVKWNWIKSVMLKKLWGRREEKLRVQGNMGAVPLNRDCGHRQLCHWHVWRQIFIKSLANWFSREVNLVKPKQRCKGEKNCQLIKNINMTEKAGSFVERWIFIGQCASLRFLCADAGSVLLEIIRNMLLCHWRVLGEKGPTGKMERDPLLESVVIGQGVMAWN